MKNLHVLATDKPTGIFETNSGLQFSIMNKVRYGEFKGFHLYITSDEEIKLGDYMFDVSEMTVYECIGQGVSGYKIILTTDQSLDDVQKIDDEFLEWFVKNPSCEEVETAKGKMKLNDDGQEYGFPDMSLYKIIIPKEEPKYILCGQANKFYRCVTCDASCGSEGHYIEEPKQELKYLVESWQKRQKEYEALAEKHRDCEHTYKKYTYRAQATRDCWKELLTFNKTTEDYYDDFKMIEGEKIEEAAKRFWKESKANPIEMAIFGAEWQQEQDVNMVQSYLSANLQNIELLEKSYSQEEVDVLIHELINKFTNWSGSFVNRDILIEIYEQFKKKV